MYEQRPGIFRQLSEMFFKMANPPLHNEKYFIHAIKRGERVFYQDRDNLWREGVIVDVDTNWISGALRASVRTYFEEDECWREYYALAEGFFRNTPEELEHLLALMEKHGVNPDTFYWWPEELAEALHSCRQAWKKQKAGAA